MRTSPSFPEYATIDPLEKLELQFFKWGIQVKPSEVKQEYPLLQIWGGMIRQQKASGLSVKSWCAENGVSENTYYYRLRKIRQRACVSVNPDSV